MDKAQYREIGRTAARLRPNGLMASWVFLRTLLLTGIALYLSSFDHLSVWIFGQIIYGLACFHWFVILHDAGHECFFRSTRLNNLAGTVASIFCLVPYYPWKVIHALHHKWTGWKDRDPTTMILAREQGTIVRWILDWSWLTWFPICSLSFSLGNFWNLAKLRRFCRNSREFLGCALSIMAIVAVAGISGYFFGWAVLSFFFLGHFFFLVLSDPMIISQHGHLDAEIAGERKVAPFSFAQQDRFTRELDFPRWVSRFVFMQFNRHLTHHYWPRVPSYLIEKIEYNSPNRVHWLKWFRTMKRARGSTVILGTRSETGISV